MQQFEQVEVNNVQDAWKHYRESIKCYRIGSDRFYLSFDFDEDATVQITIPHFQIQNKENLYTLIKTIIDEMPILSLVHDTHVHQTLGAIKCSHAAHELSSFHYKNCRFYNDGEHAILHVKNPAYDPETI